MKIKYHLLFSNSERLSETSMTKCDCRNKTNHDIKMGYIIKQCIYI